MSTNYYVRPEDACPVQCDRWVHLGKSSIGWAFTFRAYPDGGSEFGMAPSAVTWPVTDFASWLRLLGLGEIYDEYGQPVARDDLLANIEAKRGGRVTLARDDYLDEGGNRFVPEYFS
jgi:hypothetical protein